jgi:8-oxo-dGTP pyrophosphatase MutT (NUDIX family)
MKIISDHERIKPTPDKARVMILDGDNKTCVANYDGCLMYPGGKLDNDEDSGTAAIREIREELGLTILEPKSLFTFQLMAPYYPERDGTITQNRIVETDYFLSRVPKVEFGNRQLTEKERLGKFTLWQVGINDVIDLVNEHQTENDRWEFFKQEILIVTKKLIDILGKEIK